MPYIIGVIAMIVIGVGFTLYQSNLQTKADEARRESNYPSPAENAPLTQRELDAQKGIETAEEPVPVTEKTNGYNDGTYTTNTTYVTPKRDTYALEITLTLSDEIITDAKVEYSQGAESDPNPQRFEKAYRAEVIGKNIADLNLSRVGGASLTTNAFNNALNDIKEQAS